MPEDEDKYPTESGRRRFVKGVVGSAVLSSVGAGGAAAINTTTSPTGAGGGATQYVGIQNVDGPAPRGMPMIPLTIENGELKGVWPDTKKKKSGGQTITVAQQDIGGTTYSARWFQYCGVQTYAGIQPTADQDNFFRNNAGTYAWQDEFDDGTKLTVDMFANYEEWGNGIGKSGLGKPAKATWRSKGDAQTIPVQVLRSPEVSKMVNGEKSSVTGIDYGSTIPGDVRKFLGAATEKDFMAWLNKCTHFCCVPGFKAYAGSKKFGAANEVYCQCHQSVYEPFSPVKKQFIALPRPTE